MFIVHQGHKKYVKGGYTLLMNRPYMASGLYLIYKWLYGRPDRYTYHN